MKILLLNNYPMDKAFSKYKQGQYPGHHLWGAAHLQSHGIETIIPPFIGATTNSYLKRVAGGLGFRVDYIRQQFDALRRSATVDIVYSACQNNTQLLAQLRRKQILKKESKM